MRITLALSAFTFAFLALTVHVTQSIAQTQVLAREVAPVAKIVRRDKNTLVRAVSSSSAPRIAVLEGFRPVSIRGRYVRAALDVPAAPVMLRGDAFVTDYLRALLRDTLMTDRHRELATSVLSLLQPSCQNRLETFSVIYDNPAHRGLAGRGVVIVAGNVPDEEFVGLLFHEAIGHFQDITCLTGDPKTGLSPYRDGEDPIYRNDPSVSFYSLSWSDEFTRRNDALPEDFVSGYAYQSDSFEDLAESMTYYLSQHEAFTARAETNPVLKAKLEWLDIYMAGRGGLVAGNGWDGNIPWDATKLVQSQ